MAQAEEPKRLLETLLPKWIELYDRSFLYFFAVVVGVTSLLGKEVIVSGVSLDIAFAANSTGSWFVLWTCLLFAAFLLWYNYVSEILVATNFALAESDRSYRAFILDKDRLRANAGYLVLSHAALFGPPLAVLVYYSLETIASPASWFAHSARVSLVLYCAAIFLRARTLLMAGARLRRLRQSVASEPSVPVKPSDGEGVRPAEDRPAEQPPPPGAPKRPRKNKFIESGVTLTLAASA